MVRGNGANTNTEIRALLSPHPLPRRSRFNAPSPAHGRRDWLPLAARPALGAGRAEGGQARAACARLLARILQTGAALPLTRGEAAGRPSAETGETPRRVNDRRRQGPRARIFGADK
jgi:hypothetical protein